MNDVLIQNEIMARTDATIDIEDRGYQFGDGIYEVIRMYNGKPYTMKEHLARLVRSASEIRLSLPYSISELETRLLELARRNSVEEGIIYVQVTRGVAPRVHSFPSPEVPSLLVAYTKEMYRPLPLMQKGVKAILVEDICWLRCDIKSLNLLGNILAKQTAVDQNCYEAIQHRGDTVTEGSATNVFMIHQGILYTHPASNLILNGTTRTRVIQLCQQLQYIVKEEAFTVQQLLVADEVFITSTTNEIMPVIQINGTDIGTGIPGSITSKLQSTFNHDILPT
jgi:D-alanine transaminase